MKKIYLNGTEYNTNDALNNGEYELDNKIDDFCDQFYDGTTEEERKKGIEYHYNGLTILIVEESVFTADKETGTIIDEFNSIDEAKKAIAEYEEQDKKYDAFSNDFYDVIDENHNSLL